MKKGIKIFILLAVTLNFIIDCFITSGVSLPYKVLYFSTIAILEILIILWMYTGYKPYIKYLLLLFLGLYTYFNYADTEIKQAFKIDSCLDNGLVWDYGEKTCRDDCLSYNEVDGCIPLEEVEEQHSQSN